MATETKSSSPVRRNRIIAIVAGAITVVAIVLGFAGDFLGLGWRWMRPAAELLLLAELVALVVIERHQLFEPVHETVGGTHALVQEIHAIVSEGARNAGQVTVCGGEPEVYATAIRVLREAAARDQSTPQILRAARLSGHLRLSEDSDLAEQFEAYTDALKAFFVNPGSPPDARSRRWSGRVVIALASRKNFDEHLDQVLRRVYAAKPTNVETKILIRAKSEAVLAPLEITDRDAVLTFDDGSSSFKWGLGFHGEHYRALLARWFDDLWASIPDSYLIYSRGGFNEDVVERIRKELASMEASRGD